MVKTELNNFFTPFKIKGMIIGNDLDALLSACLLKSRFGLDIVGIYDYQLLWYDSNLSKEQFLLNIKSQKYLAVDLDIYRNFLPSIGHHILSIHPKDILPQHRNTLNPNFLVGITHQKFKQKYPMGTVHLLMHILNEYPVLSRFGELLIWLADSTFINAQSHRFRDNVNYWLKQHVPNRIIKNGMDVIDSFSFEEEMENLVLPVLEKTGIARGKGQTRSQYKKLQGYQCQWDNPNDSRKSIVSILDIIQKNTNWKKPKMPFLFNKIKGNRQVLHFSKKEELKEEFLRNFLAQKKVFSYVITNKYLLNYTTGIDY